MADLTLSFVSNFNERVEPLMNGTVKADGIDLIPTYSHPSETFWRQLKFQEFQVGEMSMSSYLIARSRGVDMIAIPGSRSPAISWASGSASASTNRPRPCGPAAYWTTTSAYRSTKSTGTWSE